MPFLRNAIKLGIAKKILDQARKPENQARIRRAIASARNKSSRGRTGGSA
jgi:hypothetical protein